MKVANRPVHDSAADPSGWLDFLQREVESVARVDDRLVLERSFVRCEVSATSGFPVRVEAENDELDAVLVLESLEIDGEVEGSVFDLPEGGEPFWDRKSADGFLLQAMRRHCFEILEARTEADDLEDEAVPFLAVLHEESLQSDFAEWIRGTEEWIEGWRDWLLSSADQGLTGEALQHEVEGRGASFSRIVDDPLQGRLGALSLPPGVSPSPSDAEVLLDLDRIALERAYAIVVAEPLLDRFDEASEEALER